jgi:DNA-binding NarL/FixJ family response regulator
MNMTTAAVSYRDHWTARTPLRLEPAPTPRAVPEGLNRLTARELTVLRAMATGASNAEIARDLFLSVATVKTHVARVLAKLGLRDRTQAVVFAYESRLVVPR